MVCHQTACVVQGFAKQRRSSNAELFSRPFFAFVVAFFLSVSVSWRLCVIAENLAVRRTARRKR